MIKSLYIQKNYLKLIVLINFLGYFATTSYIDTLANVTFLSKIARIISVGLSLLILFFVFINQANLVSYFKEPIISKYFLFTLFCFPSLFYSSDPLISLFKLLEIILLCASLAISTYYYYEKYNNLVFFVIYLIIFQTFLIWIQAIIYPSQAFRPVNSHSLFPFELRGLYPFINSNTVGAFGGISALYFMYRYFLKGGALNRFFLLIASLFCFFTLILSQSRTSFAAFIIAFILLSSKLATKKFKIVGSIIILVVLILLGPNVYDYSKSFLLKGKVSEIKTLDDFDQATSRRFGMWAYLIDNPDHLIFGNGFGTSLKTGKKIVDSSNAHNSMIEVLVNAGIIAMVFWFLVFLKLAKKFIYITSGDLDFENEYTVTIFTFALVLFVFIRSLGNTTFVYNDIFAWLMVTIIGFYEGLSMKLSQSTELFHSDAD